MEPSLDILENNVYVDRGSELIPIILHADFPSESARQLAESLESGGKLSEANKKRLELFAGRVLNGIAEKDYAGEGDVQAKTFVRARLHEVLFLYELAGASHERIAESLLYAKSYYNAHGNQELRDYIDRTIPQVEDERRSGNVPAHIRLRQELAATG